MTGLLREARLSRSALEANIAVLLETRAAEDIVVDVRADAYGHGLAAIVAAAAEHGIRRFRVSPGVSLASGLESEDGEGDPDSELVPYGFASQFDADALHPVLSLVGEVVAIKNIPAESAISYGYTYRTERDGTIALVGLGYADGVPRLASNTGHAALGGQQHPIAGRIAMDQFVLDLGDRHATVGDEVTLWGDQASGAPALRDWAGLTRRTRQHLTAGLGWRIRRRWTGVSAPEGSPA